MNNTEMDAGLLGSTSTKNVAFDPLLDQDYDLASIEEDPRFVNCRKELFGILILCAISFAILGTTLYVIDWGNIADYKYILGLPQWVFVTGFAQLVFIIFASFVVNKLIKDESLDDVIE